MIKEIICWGRSKLGSCHLYSIDKRDEDIRIAKMCLSNLYKLQAKVENCIEKSSIDEVLRFGEEYVDQNYWYEVQDKEMDRKVSSGEVAINYLKGLESCKLKPEVCDISYASKNRLFKKLTEEIDSRVQRYNNDLAIIKKIQNYCMNYSEHKVHTNDTVYFRFGRDKHNELIALYFNIDNFIKSTNYEPIETVYVFSGDGEYPYHKQTVLHLKYEEYGNLILTGTEVYREVDSVEKLGAQVHICDFQSYNRRRGHGSFILKNLEDIIKVVNKKITTMSEIERQRYHRRKIIKAINGVIAPGNISDEDLVKFYNKNGLTTIGKKYANGTYYADKIIYKEIK